MHQFQLICHIFTTSSFQILLWSHCSQVTVSTRSVCVDRWGSQLLWDLLDLPPWSFAFAPLQASAVWFQRFLQSSCAGWLNGFNVVVWWRLLVQNFKKKDISNTQSDLFFHLQQVFLLLSLKSSFSRCPPSPSPVQVCSCVSDPQWAFCSPFPPLCWANVLIY